MPLIPNLPPKPSPLLAPHFGILALPPPPPRYFVQNQVASLPNLPYTSSNTSFGSNEAERIR